MLAKVFVIYAAISLVISCASASRNLPDATTTPSVAPTSTAAAATPVLPGDTTPIPLTTASVGQVPVRTTASYPSVYADLLKVVPDTPVSRAETWVIDVARVRRQFEIDEPGPDTNPEIYMIAMWESGAGIGGMPWISGFTWGEETLGGEALDRRQFVGFDFRNVDQTIEVGNGPRSLEIVRGRFDPSATRAAIAGCVECPVKPTVHARHGVEIYAWGDDFETNSEMQLELPLFDRYGRGGRLAVTDEFVFHTVYDEGIFALVDALTGDGPSLGDSEVLTLLANGMDDLDAYSFVMTERTLSADPSNLEEPFLSTYAFGGDSAKWAAIVAPAPTLKPYRAIAEGQGRDSQGKYVAVALVHSDEQSAAENVKLLRQRIAGTNALLSDFPWSDLIEEADIWTDGRVLMAKLRGVDGSIRWLGSFTTAGDPLFVHE